VAVLELMGPVELLIAQYVAYIYSLSHDPSPLRKEGEERVIVFLA
jgi:hypothetical protein